MPITEVRKQTKQQHLHSMKWSGQKPSVHRSRAFHPDSMLD